MMDANGLTFWMLANEADWKLGDVETVRYDRERRRLRLDSEPPSVSEGEIGDQAEALARLAVVPRSRDRLGAIASWSSPTMEGQPGTVRVSGAVSDDAVIFSADPGVVPTDVAIGHDDVLYVAMGGAIVLQDLLDRWDPVTVEASDFVAWRLAAIPGGGVWALDRDGRKLARLSGLPLPRVVRRSPAEAIRPVVEHPHAPSLTVLATPLPAADIAAIAAEPDGRPTLLMWGPASGAASIYRLRDDDTFGQAIALLMATWGYSLAWLSPERFAVLTPGLREAARVYDLRGVAADLVGDLYQLRQHDGGPFLHRTEGPPHYPRANGSAPLLPLSLPAYRETGLWSNATPCDDGASCRRPFDGGEPGGIWHRLYLEAIIPPRCGVVVRLAATDLEVIPGDGEWYEHRFGQRFAAQPPDGVPRGVWLRQPSELPHHPGLLGCPPEPDRAGLFTVLIQRANRRVRALRGRYLWIEVELHGTGRATPEIAALRAYGPRFSYADHYLPEFYREAILDDAADEIVAANESTRADFLGRFLALFESELTPLEDRVAAAHLLTDARHTPDEALDWLAAWVGLAFDPELSTEKRRRMLEAAPALAKRRGTHPGLALALDVATNGGVSGGEIVPIEGFRLRRTFATILGADLENDDDPLLPGLAESGNSFVGDSAILGEELRPELLALFAPEIAGADEADVLEFFDQLAHRVTVLVHEGVEPQDVRAIARVVELEAPAHVSWTIERASVPFMIGAASLVGIDSYLAPKPTPVPFRLGRSVVGERDRIEGLASLDPRLSGVT